MKEIIKTFFKRNYFLLNLYILLYALKKRWFINKVVKILKENEGSSDTQRLKLQNNKLLDILKYASTNTTYYKKIFNDHHIDIFSVEDLTKIPFLTKDIIKEKFPDLISKEFNTQNLAKKNTGGSTGEPLEFYCTTNAGLIDLGHHAYLYSLMGHKKGDIIISCGGLLISKKLRTKNIFWIENEKGSVFGDYRFSALYLSEDNISHYIEKLLSLKPAILRGYPSSFDTLAVYILKNNIEINFRIKGVNLTAEVCSVTQRDNIEKAFNTMVYFEYGHSEVCLYCYTEDKSYVYKSSPIYGYIEILNDDGTETEIGKVGNVIVTGFNNLAMPFIRYKTGDLAQIAYRNGGYVELNQIFGRTQDYILLKTNEKIYLTALIFGQHLKAFAVIKQWQIIQNKLGEIDILIIPTDGFKNESTLEIEEKIKNIADVEINFIEVNEIPRTKAGKQLFFVQNIKKLNKQ